MTPPMHLMGSIYSPLQPATRCTVSKSAALYHDTPLDLSCKDFTQTLIVLFFEGGKKSFAKVVHLLSKMPRSFLVKKHINSTKKPNYSELESPTGKVFKVKDL